jgi:hypothetical protein
MSNNTQTFQENLASLTAILSKDSPALFEAETKVSAMLRAVRPESWAGKPAVMEADDHNAIRSLRKRLWGSDGAQALTSMLDEDLRILDLSARLHAHIETMVSAAGMRVPQEEVDDAEAGILDLVINKGFELHESQADLLLSCDLSMDTLHALLPYLCPEPPTDTFGNLQRDAVEASFARNLADLEFEATMDCRREVIETMVESLRYACQMEQDGEPLLGDEKTARLTRVASILSERELVLRYDLRQFLAESIASMPTMSSENRSAR